MCHKSLNCVLLLVLPVLALTGCASAESMGVKCAKKVVDVEKIYYEFKNQEFKKLVNNFDRYGFKTRLEVKEYIEKIVHDSDSIYDALSRQAEEYYSKYGIRYITNEEEAKEFNFAYESYLAFYEEYCEDPEYEEFETYSDSLVKLVANIIPVKPDMKRVKSDLVGRTVYGVEGGYFKDSWRCWIADSTVIKSVKVLEENRPDKSQVEYRLNVILQGDEGGAYDIKTVLTYSIDDDEEDWTVYSLDTESVDIVRTGKYKDYITSYVSSYWDNYMLNIKSSYDESLVVGVKYNYYGSEVRRAFVVEPGRIANINLGNSEYSIDFVELLPEI